MVFSVKPATFATIHPEPFAIPTNPGPAPDPDIIYAASSHTGYSNVTLRQLLEHLFTTYAAIYQFDLKKNQEKTTARYDPNAPIETLFEQITDDVAYAELGDTPFM